MKEGPPATICGGRWLRGQFSMLMMDSLLQSASSNGRLCRLGLSFRYRSSRFSRVPVGWREKGCKRVAYRLVWPCLRAAVSSYRSPPVGAAAGSLPSPGTSGW